MLKRNDRPSAALAASSPGVLESLDRAADQVAPERLVEILMRSPGVRDAVLDQHYHLTAVMVEWANMDGHRRPILVELLNEPAAPRPRRWTVMVFDELTQRQGGPVYAATSEQAIREIPWDELEPISSPSYLWRP